MAKTILLFPFKLLWTLLICIVKLAGAALGLTVKLGVACLAGVAYILHVSRV